MECGEIWHQRTQVTSWRTGTKAENLRNQRSRHGTRRIVDIKKRYAKVRNMFRATPQDHHTSAQQQLSHTCCFGWMTKNATNCLQWESQRGKSNNIPDDLKKEAASWSCSGTTRREEQENKLTHLSSSSDLHVHIWHESHHRVHCTRNTSPPSAASPFRTDRAQETHDDPSKAVGDGNARRRRVRSHLFQAAFVVPDKREKDACLEALMEQQDWDESPHHWAAQDGNEPNNEQHGSPTQPMPIRVKAAANLRQTLPAKSPPPHSVTCRRTKMQLRSRFYRSSFNHTVDRYAQYR